VEVCTSLGAAADVSRLQAAFRPGHPPPKASWQVLGLPWLHPHKALPHTDETTNSQRQHVSTASYSRSALGPFQTVGQRVSVHCKEHGDVNVTCHVHADVDLSSLFPNSRNHDGAGELKVGF
jgi:hypothetical protein